ncbi:putative membrane protein required for colicin V production [Natronobacillus azotifigens]|uniref:CvpA family protein n=1 Tax=Natronobacillus azotifigens TaxID=472978 RepID=A0A9J6RFN4_9BACI|nr:CvpA family protein [Natronobacillus azotifigens]MCZ0704578.1 CvpA family protein [Natronobacillus azotifigens]
MIDLLILALLVLGVLRGLKRGFILQFFHFISFFVAFFVAVFFYGSLAQQLEMIIPYPRIGSDEWAFFLDSLPLESAYYNAIAFAILFFVTKIVLSIISSMLDFVAELPILNMVNGLLGAVFGFFETYLVLFVLLYIGSLLPISFIQNLLESSSMAAFIVEHTPIFSNQVRTLWFEHVLS